ncbi:MAG: CAP domain-containing protein [Planctomycetota bacterium]|jgi:hypothetical protein
MKRLLTLTIIITAAMLLFAAPGCSKKHKSDRDSAPDYGTGTGGTGTGSGTGNVTVSPTDRPPSNYGCICTLFDDINAMRSSPLKWDESIRDVAHAYAGWLAENEMQYSQTADGKSVAQRLNEGGVSFNVCGETGTSNKDSMPVEPGIIDHVMQYLDTSVLTDSRFNRIGISCDGWGFTG